MENENAPEGGDNNPNQQPEAVAPKVDIESLLDSRLGQMESRLLERLNEKQKAEKRPELTPEQYQQLLKENPAAAIDMAVDRKVQERLKPEIDRITVEQRRIAQDTKAEQDFPALKTDQAFQREVSAQIADFVRSGEYDKTSPVLVYRAAELVSLRQGAKRAQGNQGKGGISGEAPTTTAKDQKAGGKKPDNFSTMANIFGLSKESQERFLAKQKAKRGE
jgi:hypothetical protein